MRSHIKRRIFHFTVSNFLMYCAFLIKLYNRSEKILKLWKWIFFSVFLFLLSSRRAIAINLKQEDNNKKVVFNNKKIIHISWYSNSQILQALLFGNCKKFCIDKFFDKDWIYIFFKKSIKVGILHKISRNYHD